MFVRILVSLIAIGGLIVTPNLVSADNYSAGNYGECTYSTCGITLNSSGTVNLDVIPSSGTKCTVTSDTVSVMTDAITGYTLTIADTDTTTTLSSAGGSIATTSGTHASPATLAANTWGYRVDGIGSFGAGPTSSVSSGSVPSASFAQMPSSSGSANIIATSASAANPAVETTVWYGLCASISKPSDTYSDVVTYTAVVN